MGQQIIQQPDGNYALWSSVVDAFVLIDARPKDIVEYWLEDARRQFEDRVQRVCGQLANNQAPYYQFTMNWQEALDTYKEIHGKEFDLERERKENV